MPRPQGADDQDWEFLDRVIALALDINQRMQTIKNECDEPEILRLALHSEGDALLIQKATRDYRPRLEMLKKKSRPVGGNGPAEAKGATEDPSSLP